MVWVGKLNPYRLSAAKRGHGQYTASGIHSGCGLMQVCPRVTLQIDFVATFKLNWWAARSTFSCCSRYPSWRAIGTSSASTSQAMEIDDSMLDSDREPVAGTYSAYLPAAASQQQPASPSAVAVNMAPPLSFYATRAAKSPASVPLVWNTGRAGPLHAPFLPSALMVSDRATPPRVPASTQALSTPHTASSPVRVAALFTKMQENISAPTAFAPPRGRKRSRRQSPPQMGQGGLTAPQTWHPASRHQTRG